MRIVTSAMVHEKDTEKNYSVKYTCFQINTNVVLDWGKEYTNINFTNI